VHDHRDQRNELDELRNGAIMATAFSADGVTMTQRLSSWLPDPRIRAAFVLAFVSLLPLRAVHAHPDAPPAFQDQAKEKSTAVRLEPGTPVEKELAGGATDTYEIQVGAGQFLHAVVNQMGIDVALTLYGPDGKQIATMHGPDSTIGPQKISAVADSSGLIRMEITSVNKNGSVGRYRVRIDSLHAPTEADRTRISAERTFEEALELSRKANADSSRNALQKYEDILSSWRTVGDGDEEALTLGCIAVTYFGFGESQKALEYLTMAVRLWQASGDLAEEAITLNNIGATYNGLGEQQKALDYYDQALQLQRALADRTGEAFTLHNIGSIYSTIGEEQKALDYYGQALPVWRALGERLHEGETLHSIGAVYSALADQEKALEYYNQALPIEQATKDQHWEAYTLNGMGNSYNALGEHRKALDYYNRALPIEETVGEQSWQAVTLHCIGVVYTELGDHQRALAYFNQALPIERAVGYRLAEAGTLTAIGRVYGMLGDQQKALQYYEQGLPIQRAVGYKAGEAGTLGFIGRAHAALSEHQKALDYYEQSVRLWRTVGDRNGEATILDEIGKARAELGDKDQALANYSQALALASEVKSLPGEATVLGDLMTFWRNARQPQTAVFFGKQSINKYQQVRANIRGLDKELQQSFLKSKEKAYRELADLLITQGRLPEAEQVLDLLKNEEYFEFIRRDSKESASLTAAAKLTTSEDAVHREYEENVERVTAIGNEYAALRAKPSRTVEEEQHLKELSERMTVANETWEKFLSDLYAELGKTKEAQQTVENVQESASGMQRVVRELGPGAVALYTFVGEEKYHVIVVTSTVTVARDYPVTAEELRKKVFEFRRVLMDPASDPLPKAQELYTILIGPIEKQLEGAKAVTLMWSLDGVLRYLPMAALHDGHRYLVEKYRNTVFTPASVPGLTGHLRVAAWQGLGMGVSKAYGGFLALPAVPDELHRIIHEAKDNRGEGVMPGRVMLDESFTPENMEKALQKNYPLVHIASHFDFSPGNETESFLLLGGNEEQGTRLTLAELRKNPAFSFSDTELLTLSACNTAVSGAAGDGREVDGIGFLAQLKGARAVVASLWGVNDQSTGVLMEQFYKLWTEHRNMPKAEALREAQLALLRGVRKSSGNPQSPRSSGTAANAVPHAEHAEYAHPFYWAPFILIGNWR
jgi:CHAT domain-containing protein/Tfp pilus assembly protein PilF